MLQTTNLKSHIINRNDYQVIKEINRGGFGIVYLVENKTKQQQLAAKVNLQGTTSREYFDKLISRELGIFIRVHKLSFQLKDDDDTIETHLHDLVSEEHNLKDDDDDDEDQDEYSRYCLPGVDFDCVLDYIDEITSSKSNENQHQHQQSNEKEMKCIKELKEHVESLEKKHQQEIESLKSQINDMKSKLTTLLSTKSVQQTPVAMIDLDDYEIINEICNDGSEIAFQATDRKTGNYVLIRAYCGDEEETHKKHVSRLISISSLYISGALNLLGYRYPLNESEIKMLFSHLVIKKRSIGRFSSCFVAPFCQNGSLENHLQNYHKGIDKEKLNSTRRTKIIFGIAAIMKKLHKHKIIHRDLKPEQIFLNDNFEPLIDYSNLSKIITDPLDMTMNVGTPLFMAPELFKDGSETYGLPVDVYAFAIILYRMFTNELQFDTKQPVRTAHQFMMNISRGKRPIRQNNIPDCYWQLIERCWKQKPEERPTFAEITEILKDDQYVLHDCGEPDLNEIHRYRNEIDN